MNDRKFYIISVSYGNDSISLIQWVKENGIQNAVAVYCDTKWAHSSWAERILRGERMAKQCGIPTHRIEGDLSFKDMVIMKNAFPYHGAQFCTGILKGVPFLDFCDRIDPDKKAVVMIGKRRAESHARANIPEFIERSKYHDGRTVWHPLYMHTDYMRNKLLQNAGFDELPHRSLECCPCVNAGKKDLLMIDHERIYEIRKLENYIGKPMFRAKKHMGALGIDEILEWATSHRGEYGRGQLNLFDGLDIDKCAMGLCGS